MCASILSPLVLVADVAGTLKKSDLIDNIRDALTKQGESQETDGCACILNLCFQFSTDSRLLPTVLVKFLVKLKLTFHQFPSVVSCGMNGSGGFIWGKKALLDWISEVATRPPAKVQ